MTKHPEGWELVERCACEMDAEGRTLKACKAMGGRVRFLLRYLEEASIPVRSLDSQVVWDYQKSLLERRSRIDGEIISKYTVAALMTAAGFWCSYLVKWGVLQSNPVKQVKKVKTERPIPYDVMKEEEMDAFLTKLEAWEGEPTLKAKAFRYRAHVMAEVQYASGIRIDELGELREDDVDWERGIITVRHGKGNKQRKVFLNTYALDVLSKWREMRSFVLRVDNVGKDRLFGALGNSLIHSYNRVLNKVAKEVGRPGWTSHKFRHALGYHLLRSGCKLRHIQAIMGHERIQTTEVYTKVDEKDAQLVLDSCHPRRMS
jgi:integrase/recombinase XerD